LKNKKQRTFAVLEMGLQNGRSFGIFLREKKALRLSWGRMHMMEKTELHLLLQQMGQVLSGIHTLHETIETRQVQAEKLQELVSSELVILRRDQRELEEKIECVIFVMQHDVGALRSGTNENTRSIDELVAAVDALRAPITDIVLLKSRIAGLVFGLGLVGSALLWLAEPVYRWIVDAKLLRQWGG